MSATHPAPVPGGFTVEVTVLRVERLANTKDGNPRWRLHTESGVYTTAADIQRGAELTGEETGPAVLRIQDTLVTGWTFPQTGH